MDDRVAALEVSGLEQPARRVPSDVAAARRRYRPQDPAHGVAAPLEVRNEGRADESRRTGDGDAKGHRIELLVRLWGPAGCHGSALVQGTGRIDRKSVGEGK